MFKGTVVCGKIIKLLKGKTGIIFGNSSFFIRYFNKLFKIYKGDKYFIIACIEKNI